MDEQRKYAVLFAATILAARKLNEIGSKPCPARECAISDAISNAELILKRLTNGGPPAEEKRHNQRNGRKSAARSRILKKKAREGIMSAIMSGIIPGIVMTFLAITVLVVLAAVEIRLARQAVIFALMGQLLATAWIFVTGDRVNRDIARWKGARAVHGEVIYHYDPNRAPVGSDVWLSDGTRLVVRFCADNPNTDCREDRDHVERDYWAAYKADRDSRRGVLVPLVIGLLRGFPWGLALWGFYRLIYFAMKGSKPVKVRSEAVQ